MNFNYLVDEVLQPQKIQCPNADFLLFSLSFVRHSKADYEQRGRQKYFVACSKLTAVNNKKIVSIFFHKKPFQGRFNYFLKYFFLAHRFVDDLSQLRSYFNRQPCSQQFYCILMCFYQVAREPRKHTTDESKGYKIRSPPRQSHPIILPFTALLGWQKSLR